MAKEGLENKVSKEYEKRFIKGTIWGEVGAAVGSGIGGSVGNTVLKGGNKFLNIIGGGIIGDYLLSSIVDGIVWYNLNKEEYKGINGKARFVKDQLGFHIRDIPAAVAGYAAYAPIGAALLALGAPAVAATVAASVISSGIYILGSYLSNKGYLRKRFGKEHAGSKPGYSSPAPSISPSYSPA